MLNMHYFGARIVHTHWLNTYCGIMLKKHKQFFAHFIVCALSSVCVCVCCVCMRAAPLGTYETVPIISRRSEKKQAKGKIYIWCVLCIVYSNVSINLYAVMCVSEQASDPTNKLTVCLFVPSLFNSFLYIFFVFIGILVWRARSSVLFGLLLP